MNFNKANKKDLLPMMLTVGRPYGRKLIAMITACYYYYYFIGTRR